MPSLILECAVRALLIAICVGAVLALLRVKTARVRHAVWASVALSMLALPVWTAWGPRATVRVVSPAPAPAISRAAVATDAVTAQTVPGAPAPRPAWNWESLLAGLYLLGFAALLTRLLIGTVRAQVLLRGAAASDGRLTSDACAAPVTVGWLTPSVILPPDWRQWPQAQLCAVLTHEGEHARWRDPLVQWLALLNRAVFWFHPVAWWLERRLSALSEEACDAAVLANGHDPFEYSECLLEIARAMQQHGARMNLMGMAMPGPFLPQRIRRILEGGAVQRISRVRVVCVAAGCAAVSMVFTAGAMERTQIAVIPAPKNLPLSVAPPLAAEVVSEAPRPMRKVLLAQAQARPAAARPAPQETGSIAGAVLDPSGARVPNCLVVLSDASGAKLQEGRSNPAGLYTFASLAPGHYTVEFDMPGFAKLKKEGDVEAGKPVRMDAPLEIGKINQTLQVIGRKPATPKAASAAQPAADPDRISVGGRVEHAKLLVHPDPIYSEELREQGVEGTVRLSAIISKEGVPMELKVLNADAIDPRLVQAALDSVRQWRYLPTKLNEHPVATVENIDVMFKLGNLR